MNSITFFCAVIPAVVLIVGCKSLFEDTLSLPISIPPEYQVTNTSWDSISSWIPNQRPTTEIFVELARNDKKAYIFYWDGYPFRDYGPMVEKESWKFEFLGEDASIKRTTIFMGVEQEVLVLHHKPSENTQLMIYTQDMNKEEFYELISKMRKK